MVEERKCSLVSVDHHRHYNILQKGFKFPQDDSLARHFFKLHSNTQQLRKKKQKE